MSALLQDYLPLVIFIAVALGLGLALCGIPTFPLLLGCNGCGLRILRWPSSPYRRALKGLDSSVQFVTF